ncbi:MAG: NUDIX domain-containing protein [Hyphomicrobiaceae bacterium]
MPLVKFPGKLIQPYWRMRRGLTLGAQGIVFDAEGQVLLVKHGYRPGWHFPGGGVEWGETIETALARELSEEAGVQLTARPRLHGVFANFATFPGDHIAVFVCESYDRPVTPKPTTEILESRFFPLGALPTGLADGARRRLAEIDAGTPPAHDW